MRKNFSRLLAPRSIAAIGGRDAEAVIRQCQKLGFGGEIWPVNHKRDRMFGLPCYRSLAALPEAPDAAFVAVHAEAAISMVSGLAALGTGGAIIYAAGFDEAGKAGGDRQARLIEAARDMPILGPNCYGIVNAVSRTAIWPEEHGLKPQAKGVAIISQSGNIAINISMQRRGLAISHLVAIGNQAVVSIDQLIDFMVDDPMVLAFGLYLEGISDPQSFCAATTRAYQAGKPIVAIKAGRSAKGAATAFGHTASLAGEDKVVDTLLARLGIIRADSPEALVECLKLLTIQGPLPGRRLITLSCSGGEAAIIADLAERYDVSLDPIPEKHHATIKATLNDYVHMVNPFDYHTFIWYDRERLLACYQAVLATGYDLALLVLDMPRADRCSDTNWQAPAWAFVDAAERTGARAGIVASLSESMPEAFAEQLADRGIVPFCGFEHALEAVALCGGRPLPAAPWMTGFPSSRQSRALDEWRSKKLLASIGIPSPEGCLCHSVAEAVASSEHLGFPLAAKAAGTDLVHKTEHQAVALNIEDADRLVSDCERLFTIGPAILLERMVEGPVCELLIGIATDPLAGTYLVVASGGVMTEIINDAQTLLLPLDDNEIDRSLSKLQVAAPLAGFRGRPKGDTGSVKTVLRNLEAAIIGGTAPIIELDINPLMVLPEGRGVVAADALIRIAD